MVLDGAVDPSLTDFEQSLSNVKAFGAAFRRYLEGGLVEIEEVLYEQIRVLGLQPERTQYVGREVALVEGHDHAGVAADGCSENMPVPRVGKGQTFNQDFVSGHQTVRDRPIHEVRSAIDLLGREVRPVLDQIPLPLIVDLGAPARTKAPGQGKPHEEIAQRRRIQHAGVVDRGERRTPHS